MVSSQAQHAAAIVIPHEPTVPSGKVLQVWCLNGDAATSAGLFTPAQGHAYEMLQCTPSAGQRVGVTVEPAGGSAHPTTKPIALIPIA